MIDTVEVRAYPVPTDAPAGDGTLAWLTLRDSDAERYRVHR